MGLFGEMLDFASRFILGDKWPLMVGGYYAGCGEELSCDVDILIACKLRSDR